MGLAAEGTKVVKESRVTEWLWTTSNEGKVTFCVVGACRRNDGAACRRHALTAAGQLT
jgi:hypothetical protein